MVLEERDGLRVLVDLTKQDRSDVIEILQSILTQLKRPRGNMKEAAGAVDAARRARSNSESRNVASTTTCGSGDCLAITPLTHYG